MVQVSAAALRESGFVEALQSGLALQWPVVSPSFDPELISLPRHFVVASAGASAVLPSASAAERGSLTSRQDLPCPCPVGEIVGESARPASAAEGAEIPVVGVGPFLLTSCSGSLASALGLALQPAH